MTHDAASRILSAEARSDDGSVHSHGRMLYGEMLKLEEFNFFDTFDIRFAK